MSTTFHPGAMDASDDAYLHRPVCTDLKHIPGSNGLPVMGHIPWIMRDIQGFLDRHIARYGQLARINLGLFPAVLVTHPDHLRQVFTDTGENFSSAMGYEGNVSYLYGGSIITQDFSTHKASRRIFQTAFKRSALAGYVDIMNPTIQENIADWAAQDDFRYVTSVRRILIDVGARVFFGTRPDGEEIREIAHLFHEMNHVGLMAVTHFNIPGSKHWRGQRAKRRMEALILKIIEQRRADPGDDLTSILAAERDENGELWPAELLLPHLNVLLFAAHDTTAGATSHLMMYLSRPEHRHLQERLREQAFAMDEENPSLADLDACEDMEHAVLEALRLHPAVATIMRRTTRDVRIGERDIPADTMLSNISHWVHRNPDYWSDPNSFDPERFSAARAEHKGHSFQFLPFGGGAHKCIGMHVALMNAKLILHHTLRRYRFESVPGYDGKCDVLPLPFPRRELPLKVTPL
ncbi:MAG: cytochrome P450 [Halioglobus sp.]|nr:cytochrome P450 [Halioglobus sp.]